MIFLRKIFVLLIFCFYNLIGQIDISIPHTTQKTDDRITIPVNVSDLTGLRVRSYSFRLRYDQSILKLRDVKDKGTLSDVWTWDIDSDLEDEGLYIKANGWFSLSGSGPLLYLEFKVIGKEGFTKLELDRVRFNNGDIPVNIDNGSFRVFVEKKIKFVKVGDGNGKVSIDNESFNLPSEVKLVQGLNYAIQAHPELGSKFNQWSGGINSSQNPYQFEVQNNTEIKVHFSVKNYSIVASIIPEGYGIVSGMGIYEYGETALLLAAPYGGKEFIGWSIDGELISDDPEFSFKVTDDLDITANFESLLLEINAESNPMSAGQIIGSGYYYHNEIATLKAIGNENWKFDYWSENNEFITSDSVFSFPVIENRSLTANFTLVTNIAEGRSNAENYFLTNPYPNPFNPSTTFKFGLPETSHVNFYILDLSGKVVERIIDSQQINAGLFERTFNARDLSSGVYFYYFDAIKKSSGFKFSRKGKFIFLK